MSAEKPTYEERVARLLGSLDSMARDFDRHDYGLPLFGEQWERMTALVAAALRAARAAGLRRAAEVADGWSDTKAGKQIADDIRAEAAALERGEGGEG